MEVDKVWLVEGRDASFEDIGADKFTDGGGDGRLLIRCKVRDDRAEYSQDHATATAIAYTDRMSAEEEKRLKNCRGCQAELPHRRISR